MPAVLHIHIAIECPPPKGWLGIPIHGLIFNALEQSCSSMATLLHNASQKPFRIARIQWDNTGLHFEVGILDDNLIPLFVNSFSVGKMVGALDRTLRGSVLKCDILQSCSYSKMYQNHLETGSVGREIHIDLHSPLCFHQSALDNPFPVPRLIYRSLSKRFSYFSHLPFSDTFESWVEASVRVADYQLSPQHVFFKGNQSSTLTGSIGWVKLRIMKINHHYSGYLRMLSEYAQYAGIGYKTTLGLGHVNTSGWCINPHPKSPH
jgi:CRISPR-associated endoribonuclease Cas6